MHRPIRLAASLALASLIVMGVADSAQAYIGPGAGFAIASSLFVIVWTMFLAFLALLLWPIRWIMRSIRGRRAFARAKVRRLVILGLDGMEPSLAEKFMAEGKMPNLSRLAKMGCYKKLATVTPPLSPVAWSSFLTGVNPGKHNIYDFLNSDRRSYLPNLSSVSIHPPTRTIRLGKFTLPLNKPEIRLLRKGKPFWNTLGEHGIFTSVIRVPITWPPEKCRGVVLSAMCVPDLRGTQGMFSFYSTRPAGPERTGGEQIVVKREGDVVRSHLVGPDNSVKGGAGAMTATFEVRIVSGAEKAKRGCDAVLTIDGESHDLSLDVYSPWITATFKAGAGIKVTGITRFLLVSVAPEFELYAMPINLDPEKPAMPISYPTAYSTYLAKRFGSFATLGLAEDTWALNEELIDDDAFLEQCVSIDGEREEQFFDALDNTRRGLCVCVFDGTDRIQHMFWRYLEPDHPANPRNLRRGGTGAFPSRAREQAGSLRAPSASEGLSTTNPLPDGRGSEKRNGHEKTIEELYVRMDRLVGETMEKVLGTGNGNGHAGSADDSMLMVISDHGFSPFRRGIDLNRWLIENGYMTLKEGAAVDAKYLANVDWSKTRAYALGLTGMFINQKGREAKGIVEPGEEMRRLKAEIISKMSGLKDAKTGDVAVTKVQDKEVCYKGPFRDTAPDLVVGYNRGYRVGWDTAIGRITPDVFHDNTKAWSGDHCIDPDLIPGVLFCSHKVMDESPRLMDLGPTALELFGVGVPENMDGVPLKVMAGAN